MDSRQQPPDPKDDVEADGLKGEAEHERPHIAAHRTKIIAAGHRCRLAYGRVRRSRLLAPPSLRRLSR